MSFTSSYSCGSRANAPASATPPIVAALLASRASLRALFTLLFIACATFFSAARPALASHFRYGTISYTPNGSGDVNFRFAAAFRRSGYTGTASDGKPQVGDVITETIGGTMFFFGDGTTTPTLRFVVRSFSQTEDFVIGEALQPGSSTPGLTHTYSGAGPFTAGIDSGDRIANLGNRANGGYRLTTLVRPQTTNRSPVSATLPTLVIPVGINNNFSVPAADPDGDRLRYRFATSVEAGGGDNPPNLTINSTTGVLSWNTVGLDATVFYTTQVIVEDLDSAGNIKSSIPIDLLLRIENRTGLAPELEVHANGQHGTLTVAVGTPVVITVDGTDTDAGAQVTLNSSGLPANATATPGLPVTGASGVSSTIRFTPTTAQIGTIVITFSATDNTGLQTVSPLTITVVAGLPKVSISDVSVVEGNSGTVNANFTIRSTVASTTPITLTANTANGTTNPATAGSDYVARSNQTVTIPVGATTATFTVVVNGDVTNEADETFLVNLSNLKGASFTDAQGVGTIRNDDAPPPKLSISDVSVAEGNSGTVNANFTISSSYAATSPITVIANTANGTTNPATAGSDYIARSNQTVTIPAGATTATFTVVVNGDTVREANETFFVNLSNVRGATLTDAQGVGTIRNDDTSADLQITQAVNPTTIPINTRATITLSIRNNGPDSSNNVTVVNTLPAGIGAVTSNTTFTRSGQVLTFALGTLAPGATRTITLTTTVPATAGSLTNIARISGVGAVEVNTANNSSASTGQVVAGPANVTNSLAITQGNLVRSGPYSPTLYLPGARFVQLVTIRNTGTTAITGPVSLVFDNLPAGVTVANATGKTTTTLPSNRSYLNVGVGNDNVLSVGESATVRVEFTLSARNKPSFTPQVVAGAGKR